ncbi:YhzD family protein [Virgibacillus soli]|uniref:YhzD family protein n=1 Tax=Paracerasibacillus soli TaxID=480284 RepID=A0ABU5CN79_9BACI|nr:YhzD family protein [Virgibacillus soli]MDY0407805.1 YhzD family protein [Virgibacillus soli]
MKKYVLTVFDKTGEKLLEETFEAKNDADAKTMGQAKLKEHQYEEHTHRCVSPDAKLVLFHR